MRCLIPEPTGGKLVRAQVGVIWFRLKVRGSAGPRLARRHRLECDQGGLSSDPGAGRAGGGVERAREEPTSIYKASCNHPINFNPGIIKGGDWASSVPAWCDVDCRIGVLPGWSVADCQEEIVACVSAGRHDSMRFSTRTGPWSNGAAFSARAMSSPARRSRRRHFSAATVRSIGGELPELASRRPPTRAIYGLECRHPEPLLRRRMAERMHGFNECVELNSLRKATATMALFVADWCGIEKTLGIQTDGKTPCRTQSARPTRRSGRVGAPSPISITRSSPD